MDIWGISQNSRIFDYTSTNYNPLSYSKTSYPLNPARRRGGVHGASAGPVTKSANERLWPLKPTPPWNEIGYMIDTKVPEVIYEQTIKY